MEINNERQNANSTNHMVAMLTLPGGKYFSDWKLITIQIGSMCRYISFEKSQAHKAYTLPRQRPMFFLQRHSWSIYTNCLWKLSQSCGSAHSEQYSQRHCEPE